VCYQPRYYSNPSSQTILTRLASPERRLGSTRVPGHAFLAWRSSWRIVVYIYNITAAGKFHQLVDGQLLSGQLYGTEKAGGTARPSLTKSHLPGQPVGRAAVLGLHSSLLGATLLTVFVIDHFKSSSMSLLFYCPHQEKGNHNQLQIYTFQDHISIWIYVSIKGRPSSTRNQRGLSCT
jgi:hypothetical protein